LISASIASPSNAPPTIALPTPLPPPYFYYSTTTTVYYYGGYGFYLLVSITTVV
jgi:hypothetical protein